MSTVTSLHLPSVAVIGTCDTKLDALSFIKRTIISSHECNAILIDIGTYEPASSTEINVSRTEVLDADKDGTAISGSRGEASEVMSAALTRTLARLYEAGSIMGVIGAGGSGNTTVCTKAFRDALPIGFPKVMVSTMASGDVSHDVGETDITMMYSVVDVSGMNRILEVVLGNAARAVAGMVVGGGATTWDNRPAIAISMFGVTTPCVQFATKRLEDLGYDVVVFHATGAGGMAMERLISERKFVGVLDLTTTELADELVGGVLSAGPHRLEAAAKAGIPQVVSVGALDMVNFGPRSGVPPQFQGRLFHEHNASVTLMRTTKEECAALGRIFVGKVNMGNVEKTRVVLPLRGMSLIDMEGGPFWDEEADNALIGVVRKEARCHIVAINSEINSDIFARAAVDELVCML